MKTLRVDTVSKDENACDSLFVLCVPKGWDSYISQEFYEIHQNLVALGWTLLIVDEFNDDELLSTIHGAALVMLWECYELLERKSAAFSALPKRIRRVVFCDDVHYFNLYRHTQRMRAFRWADLIFATYPDRLLEWFPEIRDKSIKWMPHAAASPFTPVFAPASDQVLLSGSRTWPYPFRQFCAAKLPDCLCHVVDHPGYPGYPGDKANGLRADPDAMAKIGRDRYAALLRRHPAVLVCGSIFHYLVAKVFEGMASGCLVIADRVSLGSRLSALGFIEGEHYIGTDLFHVIEDAAAVRTMFLKNDPRWASITEKAAKKVHKYHTTAVRAEEMHILCLEEVEK